MIEISQHQQKYKETLNKLIPKTRNSSQRQILISEQDSNELKISDEQKHIA